MLPWVVAAAALVVYLLTLNHWVSMSNLASVATASGWNWQPQVFGPLCWLLTYPFRWLPAHLVPLALNLFSAVCAALTLALLARSVALLPHDRTEAQRSREKGAFSLLSIRSAWAPPVMAAMVCGLQLTFWEKATAASGGNSPVPSNQMLDLLLFAYVIRCLLEFRIDERDSWLTRAALVCGLGMTNDWAMVGFFPVFVIALVWIKRLGFFNIGFLGRMCLWGLAGLSLFLLLPLFQSLADISRVPFWSALKFNLALEKNVLAALAFNKRALFSGDNPLWVLGLFSVLPLLVISIRWPSYFGDPSKLGVALTTLIIHLFQAVLLAVCLWTALDPQFSPRHHLVLDSYGVPGLTLYYLGALSVGYFIGYFLLVFGTSPLPRRPQSDLAGLANAVVSGLTWLLLVLTPVALISRNLPSIRITNGPMLKRYAALMMQSLPAKGVVVLSDSPRQLAIAESAAAQSGNESDILFLDTGSLKFPDYLRHLKRRYGQRWPISPAKDDKQTLDDMQILALAYDLSTNHAIYYLHPTFGYFLETFYFEPHGQVYQLKHYATNEILVPPLSKELLAENERFWAKADDELISPIMRAIAEKPPGREPGLMDRFMKLAHLKEEPNALALELGLYYSRQLDYWGVQLQRNGVLPEASAHFSRALDLNPDNVVADVNYTCNRQLQSSHRDKAQLSKAIQDEFGKYRNWNQVLNVNGPFDEPDFCYQQALVMAGGHNYRQAAQEFTRVKTLAPENFPARLRLAELYLISQRPELSVREIEEIHAQTNLVGLNPTNQIEWAGIEISAYIAAKKMPQAEASARASLAKYPNDTNLLASITQVYMDHGCFSNALDLIEKEIKLMPDQPGVLVNKGFSLIQLKNYDQAIPPLQHAVALQTNNYLGVLNLAIAELLSDRLNEAQTHYELLQKAYPTFYMTYYGLEEIAYRKKDTNTAIQSCLLYLTNAPPNTEECKFMKARLEELQHPGATNRPPALPPGAATAVK
jgi:tetratricopeptide (TPR) repeat protein